MKNIIKNTLLISFAVGFFAFLGNVANAAGPTIVSATATPSSTSAILEGSVNPNGVPTGVYFETPSTSALQSQNISGTSPFSLMPYTLTGLSPSTSYTFRIVASDANGDTTNGNWVSFQTTAGSGGGCGSCGNTPTGPTIVSTNVSKITQTTADLEGSVNPNGVPTGVYFETPSTSALQSQNISGTSPFSLMPYTLTGLSPNTKYDFRIVAADANGGMTSGPWTTFTTSPAGGGGGGGGGGGSNSTDLNKATTVSATNTSAAYSKLNAVFINQKQLSAIGYFEYGTSMSFGTKTASANLGTTNSVSFSKVVLGFKPNTTYYFRAVVESNGKIYTGNTLSFKTTDSLPGDIEVIYKDNNKNKEILTDEEPVVVETVQSTFFNITTDKENLSIGDEVNYFINFKNTTSTKFKNTKILVQLPKEIDFKESNFGELTNDNNLIFNVGTVFSKENGSMSIKGKVNATAQEDNIFVTTAIFSYNTEGTSNEKNELAYVSNRVYKDTKLAAASIFGFGSFFPSSIVGWMILIITILCLLVIAKIIYIDYYNRKQSRATAFTPENLPK